jgi:hypothetical protein
MTNASAWSTPKFLIIAFVAGALIVFTLNLVFNVLLQLEVPTAAFGAAQGVVTVALMTRWHWFQKRILKR